MLKGLKLGLCAIIAAGSTVGFAQGFEPAEKSDWKLSIGVTYRAFKSVDFKGLELGSGYIDIDVNGNPVNPQEQVAPLPPLFPLGSTATSFHRSGPGGGGSSDLDSAAGLSVVLSTPISDANSGLSLDLSFVAVSTSLSDSIASGMITDVYYDYIADPNLDPEDGGYDGSTENGGDMPPGGQAGSGFIRYKMDLALCTFGAGVSQSFDFGALDLSVGAGPTMSFAYYDIEGSSAMGSVKEDGLDVLFGLYASVDATYAINESWGVGCGLRYDWMVQDIESDLADIDVSGLSFELKAVYSF